MNGNIHISKLEVDQNTAGLTVFDIFKLKLKSFTPDTSAGWYAYRLDAGIYQFMWKDKFYTPKIKFLQYLRERGWTLSAEIPDLPKFREYQK